MDYTAFPLDVFCGTPEYITRSLHVAATDYDNNDD